MKITDSIAVEGLHTSLAAAVALAGWRVQPAGNAAQQGQMLILDCACAGRISVRSGGYEKA